MTKYETWSLILTAIYDILTFLLLAFVAYEAVIKPRFPKLSFNLVRMPKDTKSWSWRRNLLDFVLENRGGEIKNVRIMSDPDFIGWDNLGKEGRKPRSTSEYFPLPLPFLGENERHQFFWCDMEPNKEVVEKPFKVIVEFDNPVFFLPRRLKREFKFNLSSFFGTVPGLNTRFDIHNVAKENARMREELERIKRVLENLVAQNSQEHDEEENDEESSA